jgi:hypothetical protein
LAAVKKSFFILVLLLFGFYIFAQNCAVEMESLIGTYTGDCKKGKANGKGKAVGTDTYEGDFKSGLPEGKGTYVWSNGNRFTGEFSGGLKEGAGIMFYKRENVKDSIVEGYWKKDIYTGREESAYKLIFKSKLVNDLEVEFKEDRYNRITFFITNTSGGGFYVDGTQMTRMKVDEVQIVSGAYGRLFINDNHAKKTESVLEDVIYPIRFKAIIGEEQVEMEFRKPGSYVITLRIND